MIQFASRYVPSINTYQIKSLEVYKDDEENTYFGIVSYANGTQCVLSEASIEYTIRSYGLVEVINNE